MALPGFENTKQGKTTPTVQTKIIEEIINYLNEKAGTKYKSTSKDTIDEKVHKIVCSKQELADEVVDNKKLFKDIMEG